MHVRERRRRSAVRVARSPAPVGRRSTLSGALVLVLLLLVVVAAVAVHLAQGTSGLGPGDLLRALTAPDDEDGQAVHDVLVGSRLPRAAAALLVGTTLGLAGALFQSLARNPLASPDTLAVTAGAYLAVAAVAAFGISLPLWASGLTAFAGGICAAALVLLVAGRAGSSTARLVLAGSAVAMALQAGTSTLLILFREETTGLFAWGSGTLSQVGLGPTAQAAPVALVVLAVALLMSTRLDILALGDDQAAVLGIPVAQVRATGVLLAVVLTALSVSVAGPIGFVGLAAPVMVRLAARRVIALRRHVFQLPSAALVGAGVVLLADVAVRAVLGADQAIGVPVGVVTTMLGAVLMVTLARRTAGGPAEPEAPLAAAPPRSPRRVVVVAVLAMAAMSGTAVVGLLAGQHWLLTGDVLQWLQGEAPPLTRLMLDERAPRVTAALLAGAALGLAGVMVQSACRNPLAEPGILGITGGAGLGAVVVVITGVSLGGSTISLLGGAVIGALVAFAVVWSVAWRGGSDPSRLLLVGVGLSYGTIALSTFLLVRANPWDTPRIYTWLSGTTYGREWPQVVPVALTLAAGLLVAAVGRRELDLISLDADTPRLLGLRLNPVRLLVLTTAAVVAASSVVAVGVVGFVGLVAPHMARSLVGTRHRAAAPVAAMVGGTLLVTADLIGRSVIAPAQLPAGLVVALLGAPYFVLLLARTRV